MVTGLHDGAGTVISLLWNRRSKVVSPDGLVTLDVPVIAGMFEFSPPPRKIVLKF
jgi:hypothetical protein